MSVLEDAVDDSTPETGSPAAPVVRRRVGHWVRRFAIATITAVLIVGGVFYWSERPLAEAQQAYDRGDYLTSKRLAEFFLDTHPHHSSAHLIRARSFAKLGQWPEAAAVFGRIGAATVEDTHLWAESLLGSGQYTEALPLLVRVVEVQPDNANALYEITTCRMRLSQHRQALTTAEQFARLPDCEARGRLLCATIHYDLKNYDQAAAEFARMLELEPSAEHLQLPPHEVFVLYGQALLDGGKPKEALPILGRSVLWKPTTDAYWLLGESAKQVGEPARAAAFWKAALKLNPDHYPSREGLADLALVRRDAKEALEWLRPVEERPDMMASTAYLFQRAYSTANDQAATDKWKKRTQELRERERLQGVINRVLLETPDSFWAQIIRSYKFAQEGNWGQAESLLRMAPRNAIEQPFVRDLTAAVQSRGPLPPLDQLPVKQF